MNWHITIVDVFKRLAKNFSSFVVREIAKNLQKMCTFDHTSLFVFSFQIDIISSYIWFIAGEVLALSKLYLSSLSRIHSSLPVIKPVNRNKNNITQVSCYGFYVYLRAFERRHTCMLMIIWQKSNSQGFGQGVLWVFGLSLCKSKTHKIVFMLTRYAPYHYVPLSPLNKSKCCA